MIIFLLIYGIAPPFREKTYKYKTIKGARAGAARLVGSTPKKDEDGYAIGPNGDCLMYVENCNFELLFPLVRISEIINS